ncbi:MAG TPA: GNAT family N-acetyltransferase [Candidatus Dormibacteraeota bacterium]|nr:GNAT family N-acetyltransferase [Candidatus Dormibacteraeota bacterium]
MRLRTASLLDLGRIEQMHRDAEERFASEAPTVRLWALVSQTLTAILPLAQESLLYVAEEDGQLLGFVQASGSGPARSLSSRLSSLQVLNVCVGKDAHVDEVAPRLIDHLVRKAGELGVHRLFVRVPLDDPLTALFRLRGFRQFATESVLFAEAPQGGADPAIPGLHHFHSREDRALYSLYRRVTPIHVAQLEAPTYRAWRAARGEVGDQEAVDRGELLAWTSVVRGSQTRPHRLSFLLRPERELAEQLADHVLASCTGEPAWTSLRHYDGHMIDALRGRGFTILLSQGLLVRDTTLTEPLVDKTLVPSFG